jgi:hypothetical protein
MSDYVEYDDYGLVSVRCMICGTLLARRTYIEVPHRTDHTKTLPVATLEWMSHKTTRRVHINDDGYADLIICKDCQTADFNPDHVRDQIVNGWAAELRHQKAGSEKIQKVLDKKKTMRVTKAPGLGGIDHPDHPVQPTPTPDKTKKGK